MDKITVRKKVFWNAAGKMMSGMVKQIFSTHAVVSAGDCDYVVQKASLSIAPRGIGKIASLLISAAADFPGALGGIVGMTVKFSPKKKTAALKWKDRKGSTIANMPCAHSSIAAADRAFARGQRVISVKINPELYGEPEKTEQQGLRVAPPAPVSDAPVEQKVEEQELPPTRLRR